MTDERFREYVTRVGFDLSLSKSHIRTLVQIDQSLQYGVSLRHEFYERLRAVKSNDNFVTGCHGLERRGLVVHHAEYNKDRILAWNKAHSHRSNYPPHLVWEITESGRLVVKLLKVAGMYQEYALPDDVCVKAAEEEKAERERGRKEAAERAQWAAQRAAHARRPLKKTRRGGRRKRTARA